jgi:hypothetical protein
MTATASVDAVPEIAHRTGDLEVRLAACPDVDQALALRHRVFCTERGAASPRASKKTATTAIATT